MRLHTKESISKTTPPHPCPLPPGERGLIISPPLRVASGDSPRRGGDEGEGDIRGFTNDRVSNRNSHLNRHRIVFSMLLFTVITFLFEGTCCESYGSMSTSGNPEESVKAGHGEKGIQIAERLDDPEPCQMLRGKKEKLFFNIYWLGIYVGNAVLEALNEKDALRITSRARSAPVISTFYTVEDFAESLIIKGRATHFKIKQHEGRYKSDKETVFDVGKGKITYFDYRKGRKNEHGINGVVWDVISGFYFLRAQPLTVGKTIYIDVFDSNKFLKAEVSVLRREKINVSGRGEIRTVVVKPDLKSEGLFHKKGDVFIWLTDDEARIPVKVETRVSIGRVVAELKTSEIEK